MPQNTAARAKRLAKSDPVAAMWLLADILARFPANRAARQAMLELANRHPTALPDQLRQADRDQTETLVTALLSVPRLRLDALTPIARACLARNRPDAARRLIEKHASPTALPPDLQELLAFACHSMGDAEAAVSLYRDLSDNQPNHPGHALHLGILEKTLGRFDAAKSALLRAIGAPNPPAQAWLSLAPMVAFSETPELARRLLDTNLPPTAPASEREMLLFARAKLHDDLGQTEQAFQVIDQANQLHRAHTPYDRARFDRSAATVTARFGQMAVATAPRPGPTPVFVVGMPRSGTTLLETLLARATPARPCGELPCLEQAFHAACRGDTVSDPDTLACHYKQALQQVAGDAAWTIDKMPFNAFLLGPALAAMPDARVIYLQRSPMAVCFSNYRTGFGAGNDYAYDLTDIEDRLIATQDAVQSWDRAFPDRIHHLRYEDLVADPDAQITALADRLGLPHATGQAAQPGGIYTASLIQARRAVYQGSSDAWHAYAAQLSPRLPRAMALEERYQAQLRKAARDSAAA